MDRGDRFKPDRFESTGRATMHPLIARLLDPAAARAVLAREAAGQPLDADQAAFAAEVRRDPAMARALSAPTSPKAASPDAQQRVIVLVVRAATARLLEDPELGPPARAALQALRAEGASEAEALALVSQAVLEEAFGYQDDPAAFDRPFLQETLEVLPALARVDQAAIDGWLEGWAHAGPPEAQPLRLAAAEAVLEAAWGDGPQPITPEHVDDALDRLRETVAESDFQRAAEEVAGVLRYLLQQGVVGAQRLERLERLVRDAAAAALGSGDEGEAEEDP